jgi:hypothetical protein
MFSTLNPKLKDGLHHFNPSTYIHGTYRMKFIRTRVNDEIEDTTPEM